METNWKTILPAQAAGFVDDVERACGVEIRVLTEDELRILNPTAAAGRIPGCPARAIHWLKQGGTWAPAVVYANELTPGLLTHEVLHLYRQFIQKVPQLTFAASYTAPMLSTQALESIVEHVAMCPQLEALGFPQDYREFDGLSEKWAELERFAYKHWSGRRFAFMGIWIGTAFHADPAMRARAIGVLKRTEFWPEAAEFESQLRAELSRKEVMVWLVCKALGIPVECVNLAYFIPDKPGQARVCRLVDVVVVE